MTFRTMPGGDLEYEPMDPDAFEAIRKSFDMSRKEFGTFLGYTGEVRNIYMTVKRYEEGTRPIPPTIERLVLLLKWFHADHGYAPDLDNGERRPRAVTPHADDLEGVS